MNFFRFLLFFFTIASGMLILNCSPPTDPTTMEENVDQKFVFKKILIGNELRSDTVGRAIDIGIRISLPYMVTTARLSCGSEFDTTYIPTQSRDKVIDTVWFTYVPKTSGKKIFLAEVTTIKSNVKVKRDSIIIFDAPIQNRTPQVFIEGKRTITAGTLCSLSVKVIDPDSAQTTTISILNPKGDMELANGVFTWTPLVSDTGFYTVKFRGCDNLALCQIDSSTLVRILAPGIKPMNNKPYFFSGIINRTMPANQTTLRMRIQAKDLDGDSLAIRILNYFPLIDSLQGDANAIKYKSGADTMEILFTPGTITGSFLFSLRVSDGKDSTDASFVVSVGNVNRPPEFNPNPDSIRIDDNSVYKLDLKTICTDPDNDAITFKLLQDLPENKSQLDSTILTFNAGLFDTAVHNILVEASDSKLKDTLLLAITIVPKFFTITIMGDSGTFKKSPEKINYRLGDTLLITAVPNAGYEFTGWTGSVTSYQNPLKVTVNSFMNLVGKFTKYSTSDCEQLNTGESISNKIQILSASAGTDKNICPNSGLYEDGTVSIEGKVSFTIKSTY